MKIQIGKIQINKTKTYLLPCVKAYGDEFMIKINSLYKLGVGIGDVILQDSNINYEKHLFILVDTKKYVQDNKTTTRDVDEFFTNTLKWFKNQTYYEDDYVYDNIVKGHLHMIVIKFPDMYLNSLTEFKNGRFSKMFSSKEELEKLFSNNKETIAVLSGERKEEFIKKINEKFFEEGEGLEIEDVNNPLEVDFPPDKKEEFFNTHLEWKVKI